MPKILIIDDSPDVRTMLRIMLNRAGYETEVAGDGREGVDLFRRNPADLVITDMVMPEREGLETIEVLRELAPEVKIIGISAGGMMSSSEYLEIAKHMGADRTFPKPFDKDQFLAAIEELVGRI